MNFLNTTEKGSKDVPSFLLFVGQSRRARRIVGSANMKSYLTELTNQDERIWNEAATTFANMNDDQVIEDIRVHLESLGDLELEAFVARLGELKDKRSVGPLIAKLESQDHSLRRDQGFIPKALGQIGDLRAIDALINALELCWGASEAATALGKLKDLRAVEPLIKALNTYWHDQEDPLPGYAAWALGALGDKRATEPLIKVLNDNHVFYSSAAADALGELKDLSALEPLIKVMNSSNLVSDSAITALGELGDASAIEPLNSACLRIQATGILSSNDQKTLQAISVSVSKLGGSQI